MTPDMQTIGVIGTGQIGTGIAQVCCLAGLRVRVKDASQETTRAAVAVIADNLARRVSKGTLLEAERRHALGCIKIAADYKDLSDCEIVFEAVTEDKEVKRQIFAALGAVLDENAIIASTTSSISVTHLASFTDRPERFIGTHFMHPVVAMELVELIRGIATDDETFSKASALINRLGKAIAESSDFPAFIVNRLLLSLINEAVYTLHEGVGTVDAIDTAMRLGAHHPMGPLQLADFIGLDTCLSVIQALHYGLSDTKYRPCPLLMKYVEAGWLGLKTKRGFYDYRGDRPVPTR